LKSIFYTITILLISKFSFSQEREFSCYTNNNLPLFHSVGIPVNTCGYNLNKNKFFIKTIFSISNNASSAIKGGEAIHIDGEMHKLEMFFGYGLSNKLEIELRIPYINQTKGYLDKLISNWHSTFNLPGKAREDMDYFDYHISYMNDYELKFDKTKLENGFGDIAIAFNYSLLKSNNKNISLKAFLKIPNASKSKLLGSGTTDYGLALNGSYKNNSSFFYYAFGFLRKNGKMLIQKNKKNTIFFGNLGYKHKIAKIFSLVIQSDFNTPFYRKSNMKQLKYPAINLVNGGEFRIGKKQLFFIGMIEDLMVNTLPDFTIQASYTYKID
jgi:hypothetical protein